MTTRDPKLFTVKANKGAKAAHIAAGGEILCQCGGNLSRVTDSRPSVFGSTDEPTIRRVRKCDKCGNRTSTLEVKSDFLSDYRARLINDITIKLLRGEV